MEWMERFAKKGRTFDLVLVDPPSTSTTRRGGRRWVVDRDLHGLVERAAHVCAPGGTLFASTNLRSMDWPRFLDHLERGLAAAGREARDPDAAPRPPVRSRRPALPQGGLAHPRRADWSLMLLTPVYDGPPPIAVDGPADDVLAPFVRQRARLGETLRGLTADQWASPSRCEGSSTQDVINHLLVTNGFWDLSIQAGLAGEPTRYLRSFDPARLPGRGRPSDAIDARGGDPGQAPGVEPGAVRPGRVARRGGLVDAGGGAGGARADPAGGQPRPVGLLGARTPTSCCRSAWRRARRPMRCGAAFARGGARPRAHPRSRPKARCWPLSSPPTVGRAPGRRGGRHGAGERGRRTGRCRPAGGRERGAGGGAERPWPLALDDVPADQHWMVAGLAEVFDLS